MQYRFSKSRITKRQEASDQVNHQILDYINSVTEERDAETLWLAVKALGNTISQSAFNTRLKKMVEAGLVTKRAVGYNKYFYLAVRK